MNNDNKNEGNRSSDSYSDKADELKDKVKDLAGQVEELVVEKTKKLKESDAYAKLSDAFTKVEEIMEQKSREFQSGEMRAKFDKFTDKAETQANEVFDQLKDAGRKIGDQIENSFNSRKRKKDQSTNQDGGGI
jgi:F0F1-type ATP synthase membrane subunit b/b'